MPGQGPQNRPFAAEVKSQPPFDDLSLQGQPSVYFSNDRKNESGRSRGSSGFLPAAGIVVDVRGQTSSDLAREFSEQRHSPRYPFQVEVCIYPRNSPVMRGHSVDISESGLAVILRLDLPPGEIVRVEFKVPHGEVEVWAVVKHRIAFRHGLQFLDSGPAKELIHRTCRQLAMEHSMPSGKNP